MLALGCLLGIAAGLLLLRKAPTLPSTRTGAPAAISVVIPARDEEASLPRLLQSLAQAPAQIVVVDDDSTDATAAIAARYGVTLVPSQPLPPDWRGKPWASHQGVLAATSPALLFLDADTFFVPAGCTHLAEHYATLPQNTALSVLPYHRIQQWYEELSLFFNIVTAMAAGGFTGISSPRLFGQSLCMSKDLYAASGGYASVRDQVLENLHLAAHITRTGGHIRTCTGHGVLEMRMFPHGPAQLRESWRRSFAAGAGSSSAVVLLLTTLWLGGALMIFLLALFAHGFTRSTAIAVYMLYVLQIFWYARQLGSFRLASAIFYPVPLLFYFALFAESALVRILNRTVHWKGRRV